MTNWFHSKGWCLISILATQYSFPFTRTYLAVLIMIVAGVNLNVYPRNPRFRKLHRGLRRGGQVFIVQPLRGFYLEYLELTLYQLALIVFTKNLFYFLGAKF
jgi:hypothetical protein